jgi:hypothetical protein
MPERRLAATFRRPLPNRLRDNLELALSGDAIGGEVRVIYGQDGE